VQRLEPIVLQGETPDPTRIPPGCRFNPRCPALASGEAEAAGVAQACVTQPVDKLTAERRHQAACFLPAAQATRHTGSVN
jgi:peptide/nickel transport system ATP-binding protein